MCSCTSWLEGQRSPPCLGPLLRRLILSFLRWCNWCQQWSYWNRSRRRHSRAGASLRGPASENSTHALRQLDSYPPRKHRHVALSTEVCDLPRLVLLDESVVLAQVDMICGLCDNAQERTLHWANFPDALRLGRSFLTLRLNSASEESIASRSRHTR